jgi:hypothetical protein
MSIIIEREEPSFEDALGNYDVDEMCVQKYPLIHVKES